MRNVDARERIVGQQHDDIACRRLLQRPPEPEGRDGAAMTPRVHQRSDRFARVFHAV